MFRALEGVEAWLVGGAVRDRRLGRPTDDLDVAVAGDPKALAQALRRELGGAAFSLGEGFGGWRVVKRDKSAHVDLLPLIGGTLDADLAARDFTINAMAEPLAGGDLIDPFGGAADLEARVLRAVGPETFSADPLRVMRLVRLAAELDCSIDPATLESARDAAPALGRIAAERIFAELKRIVCAGSSAVRLMESVGAAGIVLPELVALQGVEQSVYHHADVHDHTLDVLDAVAGLERDEPDERVQAVLGEPLANELTRWQAMRFAALLHDIAKPDTAGRRADGRGSSFVGHDRAGAEVARSILRRLRASEKLADHVAALTLHHLRLGFLVHEQPLSRRSVHRYLQATAPWSVDITVFTCADRLATRGRNAGAAIEAHLALARDMLDHAFAVRPPAPLVRGDELARELGVTPGPKLGELLARLEEDRFAGEVTTREEAFARAREYLAER
ncbi:MAG: poly(A) polymerase [Solirubrobacteraceae bacterium]|nr:poly(A) polymerase [Solirubrobacteraceae bacterium]